MTCSSLLSKADLCLFRTKQCKRLSKMRCHFGTDRCQYSHDEFWNRRCPFFLSNQDYIRYIPVLCPLIEIGPDNQFRNGCHRGGDCPFAHSTEEVFYHPLFYKTIKCEKYKHGLCNVYYCPFIHALGEKTPVEVYKLPFTNGIDVPDYPNVIKVDRISHTPEKMDHYTPNQVAVPGHVSQESNLSVLNRFLCYNKQGVSPCGQSVSSSSRVSNPSISQLETKNLIQSNSLMKSAKPLNIWKDDEDSYQSRSIDANELLELSSNSEDNFNDSPSLQSYSLSLNLWDFNSNKPKTAPTHHKAIEEMDSSANHFNNKLENTTISSSDAENTQKDFPDITNLLENCLNFDSLYDTNGVKNLSSYFNNINLNIKNNERTHNIKLDQTANYRDLSSSSLYSTEDSDGKSTLLNFHDYKDNVVLHCSKRNP